MKRDTYICIYIYIFLFIYTLDKYIVNFVSEPLDLRFWSLDILVNLNTAVYIKGKLVLSRNRAYKEGHRLASVFAWGLGFRV